MGGGVAQTVLPDLSFGRSLTRLTVTDQRLSSLSAGGGLGVLPQLRELYLQNNLIDSLAGLEGCGWAIFPPQHHCNVPPCQTGHVVT